MDNTYIGVQACSTSEKDCPFFDCYERGTCYQCRCSLLDKELFNCVDGEDQESSIDPDCPLRKHEVIVRLLK